MPEFDNTKKAIGVTKMDESARKQMFNKFVEAGGQVLKEKPDPVEEDPKKQKTAPKTRQGTISRNEFEDSKGRSGGGRGDEKSGKDSDKQSIDPRVLYEREISSFSARLAVKFKCWFGKVTPFGSTDINPGFMHEVASTAKQALMECHFTGAELLSNPNLSPQVAMALDRISPLLVELIALSQKLYNGPEINQICEPILKAPDRGVPIDLVKSPIYSLFKRMYILYPYQETLKKALAQAYDELQKIENKPGLIYSTKKKKIHSEIDTLFEDFFEKFYLIIIRAENKNIPLISRYMENLLDIRPEDKPGQRKIGTNPEDGKPATDETVAEGSEEKTEETPEEPKEKEKPVLSKEQAYGLRIMQAFTIPQLRKKHDPKNEFGHYPDSDKAMLGYFYFLEFDAEYSLVLTTKKIVIKPVIINGVKVDYRQKMQDIYEGVRLIGDQFRAYNEVMREMKKHKDNPGANYIEASKKLSGIEQKRQGQSRTVRIAVKDFTSKVRDALLELIKDMKTKKEIVGNMEDALNLEAMESKKRLNKKAIKQCIMESYCYALALADRLEAGDLYGGLTELTPEQMMESFGIDVSPKEEAKDTSMDVESEPKTTEPEKVSEKSQPEETESSEDEGTDLGDLNS